MSDGVNPASVNGTVTLVVPHALPVAGPDSYECPWNATCAVNATAGLLANDASSNLGTNLTVLADQTTPPAEGALQLQCDGAFTFAPAG